MTLENIGETFFETGKSKRPRIASDWFTALLKYRPQIVYTMAMIGVIVGPNYRINRICSVIQQLIPQIRRCINQYPGGRAFD